MSDTAVGSSWAPPHDHDLISHRDLVLLGRRHEFVGDFGRDHGGDLVRAFEGPMVGAVVADAIEGRAPSPEARALDPRRF